MRSLPRVLQKVGSASGIPWAEGIMGFFAFYVATAVPQAFRETGDHFCASQATKSEAIFASLHFGGFLKPASTTTAVPQASTLSFAARGQPRHSTSEWLIRPRHRFAEGFNRCRYGLLT